MEAIGIFDAKTRFSELVDRVEHTGESITITNRGRPVADLTPTRSNVKASMERAEAVRAVNRLWEELAAGETGESRRMIEEGRDRWLGA